MPAWPVSIAQAAMQNWTGLGVVEVATATKTLSIHVTDYDDDEVIEWIRMVDGYIDIGG